MNLFESGFCCVGHCFLQYMVEASGITFSFRKQYITFYILNFILNKKYDEKIIEVRNTSEFFLELERNGIMVSIYLLV